MIVREGINVQYTHDDEAMLQWLLSLREFAGVDPLDVWAWMEEAWQYCTGDYYVHEDDLADRGGWAGFQSTRHFLYASSEVRAKILTVSLWRAQDGARRIVEDHGYSCVVCGSRQHWRDRDEGGRFWRYAEARRAVDARQAIVAPALVCIPCADMITELVHAGSHSFLDVDALLARAQPLSLPAQCSGGL